MSQNTDINIENKGDEDFPFLKMFLENMNIDTDIHIEKVKYNNLSLIQLIKMYNYVTDPNNIIAIILIILISGLIAGPAVSLYGSPTVSPVIAALCASEPLPP